MCGQIRNMMRMCMVMVMVLLRLSAGLVAAAVAVAVPGLRLLTSMARLPHLLAGERARSHVVVALMPRRLITACR